MKYNLEPTAEEQTAMVRNTFRNLDFVDRSGRKCRKKFKGLQKRNLESQKQPWKESKTQPKKWPRKEDWSKPEESLTQVDSSALYSFILFQVLYGIFYMFSFKCPMAYKLCCSRASSGRWLFLHLAAQLPK